MRVHEGLIQDSGVPTSPLPGGFLQQKLGGTHLWVPGYHSSHWLPVEQGCLGFLSFGPEDWAQARRPPSTHPTEPYCSPEHSVQSHQLLQSQGSSSV